MRMKTVAAFGGLACRTDIKTDLVGDMDMLVRAFRDPAANDGKVFFLIGAGRMGIDKCSFARLQLSIPDNALFNAFLGHYAPFHFCGFVRCGIPPPDDLVINRFG